ncbi:MAG: HIT domain-containing protein [Tepidisphaeraceae bacterium]|jgi:ATP adenylyltransferase
METPPLFAPWRMEYLRSLGKIESDKCFLCDAAAAADPKQMRDRLVLWKTEFSIVMMNRFPYANGHLLIAPRAHRGELEDLSDAESLDLTKQTAVSVQLLKQAQSAQGFNIGINLGRVAGAGLPGHLHQHLVPRWGGDVNFMTVVADIRIVPEALSKLYDELLRVRAEMNVS